MQHPSFATAIYIDKKKKEDHTKVSTIIFFNDT